MNEKFSTSSRLTSRIAASDTVDEIIESANVLSWSLDFDSAGTSLSLRDSAFSRKVDGIDISMWTQFVHPDDLQKIYPIYKKAKNDKESIHVEYRVLRRDGRIRWMMATGVPRFSDTGDLHGYDGTIVDVTKKHETYALISGKEARQYAIARDVTERYRTRVQLEQTNAKLNSLLETIGECFFSLDREWRVTYANFNTANFISRSRDELIGKILWEAEPQIIDSPFFPHYQRVMETRVSAVIQAYYEPVQAWVEARAYPHLDGLSVFFTDITAQRETEAAYRKSQQRVHNIIEMTPAGYVFADADLNITDANPALCAISGYTREELVGINLAALFSSPALDTSGFLGGSGTTQCEDLLRHKGGQGVHVLVNANIERNAQGHMQSVTAFLTDITERKQAEARLEQLAMHDTLTGLPNRTFLNLSLQHMLDTAPREETNAIMLIDLDRFKEVNDSMGHKSGDILLCEVARRLKSAMRPSDIVARLGGDEFLVVANCRNGINTAPKIARKILDLLAAPMDIESHEIFVGGSIGISMFPQDSKDKEELFQNADIAMYRAKAAGRNGYRFFEPEMSEEAKTRMALETSLRRALERKEFELHYQPRLNLKTMSIVGMEALIRWNHPQLGWISPMQFIPIAEERGMIESIGQWVLEEACMQTRRLIDKLDFPLRVSVNLSARQLKSLGLVEQVKRILDKTQLPASLLELEITETALVDDLEMSATILRKLKELGISLAVDDFGTGYSALAYLRSFPLDILKLDRSFVSERSAGTNHVQFIKAFVDMAHTLNLSVIAEGVEAMDTLEFLRNAACDEVQGFLLSRPLPLNELEKFLSLRRA